MFVCVHNSARSQMAEAFVNRLRAGRLTAMSAGLERGVRNPYVVAAMREIGYDLSHNATKEVVETDTQHGPYNYAIKAKIVEWCKAVAELKSELRT